MNNKELLESKINYFKSELLNNSISQDLLVELNAFLLQCNNSYLHGIKDVYVKFINDLQALLKSEKYGLDEVDKLILYHKEKNSMFKLLQKELLDENDLELLDNFFLNTSIQKYLNLDTKALRQIEDKAYRKLSTDKLGEKYISNRLENKKRLNVTLGVYLALDFYRNSHHPAQIVTFGKGTYFGHYNNESGNINIDLVKLEECASEVMKLKNTQHDNILYNLEFIQLIYHECTHFKMLYNNDDFHYENELADIVTDYNIDNIHDDFYLEYTANIGACNLGCELLKRLGFKGYEYMVYILENIALDLYNKYYHVINNVRTGNPHEEIYSKVKSMIKEDKTNDDNYNNYNLERLRKNKNEQELNHAVYDDYIFSIEEIKRILLVIMLEYKDNHTYSRFNQDIIKDILIMNPEELINKYQKIEYKKELQNLYVEINGIKNYNDEMISMSIMSLPMEYPFLDKIQFLSNQTDLVYSKC